mmetsp:Transcript_46272/g.122783  ORF Transcript_46272/g.122783 Transcript_46272/m.122783 type:complete len:381 (-) Transcript_46272:1399-2541(-)
MHHAKCHGGEVLRAAARWNFLVTYVRPTPKNLHEGSPVDENHDIDDAPPHTFRIARIPNLSEHPSRGLHKRANLVARGFLAQTHLLHVARAKQLCLVRVMGENIDRQSLNIGNTHQHPAVVDETFPIEPISLEETKHSEGKIAGGHLSQALQEHVPCHFQTSIVDTQRWLQDTIFWIARCNLDESEYTSRFTLRVFVHDHGVLEAIERITPVVGQALYILLQSRLHFVKSRRRVANTIVRDVCTQAEGRVAIFALQLPILFVRVVGGMGCTPVYERSQVLVLSWFFQHFARPVQPIEVFRDAQWHILEFRAKRLAVGLPHLSHCVLGKNMPKESPGLWHLRRDILGLRGDHRLQFSLQELTDLLPPLRQQLSLPSNHAQL